MGLIPNLLTGGGRIMCSRCQAKNRAGNQCAKPAIRGKQVCGFHGGLSTGPRTAEGIDRIKVAATKHGRFTQEGREKATAQAARIRELEDALIVLEAIPEGQRTRGPKPKGYEPVRTIADVRQLVRRIVEE
jgi:hypothetical protein